MSAMTQYRFYRLRRMMLIGSEEASAANDKEAVRLARRLARDGEIVEVWRSGRRVRTIAASRAPRAAGGPVRNSPDVGVSPTPM